MILKKNVNVCLIQLWNIVWHSQIEVSRIFSVQISMNSFHNRPILKLCAIVFLFLFFFSNRFFFFVSSSDCFFCCMRHLCVCCYILVNFWPLPLFLFIISFIVHVCYASCITSKFCYLNVTMMIYALCVVALWPVTSSKHNDNWFTFKKHTQKKQTHTHATYVK